MRLEFKFELLCAELSVRLARFVFDILLAGVGGGGALTDGGFGGATVGRPIGGLGACRILIVSCD